MQSEQPQTKATSVTEDKSTTAKENMVLLKAFDADVLDAPSTTPTRPLSSFSYQPDNRWQRRNPLVRYGLISFVVLAFGISGVVAMRLSSAESVSNTSDFDTTKLSLESLQSDTSKQSGKPTLTVNGRLQVSDSLLLTATTPSGQRVAGQLYFDKATNSLRFYNGQQFVDLTGGGGATAGPTTINNNITDITNLTQAAAASTPAASVLLQAATPGAQQSGNLNISGTAAIGIVQTQTISSDGGTLYINPAGATQQQTVVAGTPSTAGVTVGSATTGVGWWDTVSATKVTLGAVGGIADAISVYNSGGSVTERIQVALYDDDGDIPSKPGNLLASSALVNLVPNGVTTVTIPTVTIDANTTYWLAFDTDSHTLGRTYIGGSQSSCFHFQPFGSMPSPYGGCYYDGSAYAIWLNYAAGAGLSGSASQAMLVLGPTGQAAFRNTIDSDGAFKVQNSAGTKTVLNVDTLNGRVGIGKSTPGYALDIAGGDINLSNGKSVRFGGSPALAMKADGMTTSLNNFVSGGAVAVQTDNFIVRDTSGNNPKLVINASGQVGIGIVNPQYRLDVNGDINLSTGSAFKINGVDICTSSGCLGGGGGGSFIQNGTSLQTDASLAIQSADDADVTAYFEGRTNQSVPTLTIKNGNAQSGDYIELVNGGGGLVFDINTYGQLYQAAAATFGDVVAVNDNATSTIQLLVTADSGKTGLLVNGGGTDTTAMFQGANNQTATNVLIKQGSSQTGYALDIQNSSSASLFNVDPWGGLVSNGWRAILSNETAEPYFIGKGADTNYSNLIGWSPSFERDFYGWGTIGSGTGLAIGYNGGNAANAHSGNNSLYVTTASGTANTGLYHSAFAYALSNSTDYTLSFYAKADVTFPTLRVGFYDGTTENDCALNDTTVLSTGFQRYNCTFNTGAISGIPYIYITTSSTTQSTFYIDDVQLIAGTSTQPTGIGSLSLIGNVISPLMIQNGADSTSAFSILNAAGTNSLFTADTLNRRLQITADTTNTGVLTINDSTGNTSRISIDAGPTQVTATVAGQPFVLATQDNYGNGNWRPFLYLSNNTYQAELYGNWTFRTQNGGGGTTRHNIDGLDNGNVNFNIDGEATDFTIQGDTDANLFYVQGATDRLGIGTNNPGYKLDVAGDINTTGSLRFSLHLVSGGNTPGIAAGAAACTTPTVSVSGTDTAGLITVTTGTGCASNGTLATVTFANAFGAAPRVVLTPANASATGLTYYYDAATISTTAFDLKTNTTPANSTTYLYSYQVIQ